MHSILVSVLWNLFLVVLLWQPCVFISAQDTTSGITSTTTTDPPPPPTTSTTTTSNPPPPPPTTTTTTNPPSSSTSTTTLSTTSSSTTTTTTSSTTTSPSPASTCLALSDSICDPWKNGFLNTQQLNMTFGYRLASTIDNSYYNSLIGDPFFKPRTLSVFYDQLRVYCSGFRDIVVNSQYLASYFCARDIVFNSNDCNTASRSSIPRLCTSTCDTLVQSVLNYVTQNPTACQSNIGGLLADLRSTCNAVATTDSSCIKSISVESKTCGFPSTNGNALSLYCSANSDACCAPNTSSAPLSTSTIIAIVAGVVGGLIVLGILVILIFAKCRGVHSSEKHTDDYEDLHSQAHLVQQQPMFYTNEAVITKRPETLERMGFYHDNGQRVDPNANNRPDSMLLRRYRVMQDYIPNLPDELDLRVGDIVVLGAVYNDGWGQGHNETSGEDGTLPLGLLQAI